MRFVLRLLPTFLCLVFLTSSASARVETVRFQSKLVNASLPYNVILPTDYDSSTTTRYPVLYLLHGLTGHYSDWITRTNVADYASQYRMIVVTPEGNDGWYTDSVTVSTDKYESYILKELIPDVQQRYRTIEARYGRAIAGLSMGGYGSIKFGLKSPSTFVFVGSMSGAFGETRLSEQELGASRWAAAIKLFGAVDSETRKANDLFQIIKDLQPGRIPSLPFIYLDCGTEDSARVFPYNRELSALMVEKKIPHEYRELPGDHSWGYWNQQVQEVLKLSALKMQVSASTTKPKPRAN